MKLRWKELGRRVWDASNEDDVFGQAAQLSYYFLLAGFPFLLILTTWLGLLAQTGADVYASMVSYASRMLPDEAFKLVIATLTEVQKGAGGAKLGLGILATLWAASSGMAAMIEGLNRAHEVKESRPWWKTRLISIGLTLLLPLFLILAMVLVLYGSRIAEFIANYFGLKDLFVFVWSILQWPVVFVFVFIALGLLYRYAPAVPIRGWRNIFPGALAGMLLWLMVSLGFRLYIQFFNSYNKTYGSLGAVIVLLLWFYLAGAAILVGAEVNGALCKLREGETRSGDQMAGATAEQHP